jgi:hypothetical protein
MKKEENESVGPEIPEIDPSAPTPTGIPSQHEQEQRQELKSSAVNDEKKEEKNSSDGDSPSTEILLKQIEELRLQNEQLSNLLKEKDKGGSFRINPSDVYENLKYLQVPPPFPPTS